ncbi:PadR family transcriptional regulator [Streptomyces alkaliterrae]|uniref:Helix-turn-helix transcriptional regulator n=1 Tax=Streptomyces alkaliterrae TaxID=2213162 RepID=A0A5P0YRI8_9ACTN|nr:PadR family transcriptional regulator [Streptomyces alkaliterrae]MBB1252177.1 helix-turn-helix transcriptional regulator [Streptomyces alkaliterrae]MBB1258572.1 helix-turn-helix transcriptional regulator [Streptomyces alkaliterrae]MQS02941.1 PadR family transcriptional regulator [Streptomyces alkaliterrae]
MTQRVMQEPTLLLLTALADEPRHGYAITQEIRKISDGQVTMRTGTLYGALERLLKQGLIEVHREEVVDGRLRRVYTLSDTGRERLEAEAERLAATAREASRRLGAFSSQATGSPRTSAATA